MNLLEVMRSLGSEEECFAFLEGMRWPEGVRCAVCGCDRISRITRKSATKNVRKSLYQCLEATCKQQFSVTSGTVFHDSRIPLTTWFLAIQLIMEAKKGMSAMQLKRSLWGDHKGSYQTAWYMCHRIREAMAKPSEAKALLGGSIEMDETLLGGYAKGKGPQGYSHRIKETVLGIKQKNGELRFFHIEDVKSGTLAKYIKENVSGDVDVVVTDEAGGYPKAFIEAGIHGSKHKRVNHSKGVFVDGDVTTNGVESAFSLLKRGIVGSYHKISAKHLSRYLSEFEYRFNERKSETRFEDLVKRAGAASPLPYAKLTFDPEDVF